MPCATAPARDRARRRGSSGAAPRRRRPRRGRCRPRCRAGRGSAPRTWRASFAGGTRVEQVVPDPVRLDDAGVERVLDAGSTRRSASGRATRPRTCARAPRARHRTLRVAVLEQRPRRVSTAEARARSAGTRTSRRGARRRSRHGASLIRAVAAQAPTRRARSRSRRERSRPTPTAVRRRRRRGWRSRQRRRRAPP